MRKARTRPLSLITWIMILSTIALAAVPLRSQEKSANMLPRTGSPARPGSATNLRVDTTMVLIPVKVTDPSDYPVTNLSRNSFRLFEDGVEQTVQSFSRQDGPASVGFIVDASRSMEDRIAHSFAAIEQLLRTQMAGDEWFLIRFSANPTITTRFTPDPDQVRHALSSIQCGGWTALNDAIYLGLNEMRRARNSRKVLIVLTDGGDNHSSYSDSELRNLVRESDVRIYSIGLFAKPDLLEKIGRESGGRALWSHTAADIPGIVEKLSNLLRSEYVLGYLPKNRGNDEKYRHVRVQVDDTTGRRLNVSWRRGYYSSW
jgi:Ca-activated chloride channel family protein